MRLKMKILFGIGFLVILIFIISNFFYNTSDYIKKAPGDFIYIFEGGNQNSIMKHNHLIIDSGVVDFKFNKNFVIFSVDTTYSMNPKKIPKKDLKYYIYETKHDSLLENLDFYNLQKFIKLHKLQSIDVSKAEFRE